MSYLDGDQLDQRLRIAPSSTLTADPSTYPWRDVTGDVAFDHVIEMTAGAADEASETNSDFKWTFRDNNARYDVDNPSSDLYGLWDVGCPVEFAINIGDGSGWLVQFIGYVGAIGDDYTAGTPQKVRRDIVAGGTFRRLGQGKTLSSPITRNMRAQKAVRYYRLEDGSDARFAASDVANMPPLSVYGTLPQFSGRTGVPGSLPVAQFGPGQGLQVNFPTYTPSGTSIYWQFLMNVGTLTANTIQAIMYMNGGNVAQWYVQQDPGACPRLRAISSLGTNLYTSSAFGVQPGMIGSTGPNRPDSHGWWWHNIQLTKSGADTKITYWVTSPWVDNAGLYGAIIFVLANNDTLTGQALGSVAGWNIAPQGAEDMALGHLALFDSGVQSPNTSGSAAVMGWPQFATTRIAGVSNEMGLPNNVSTSPSALLGPQQPGTTLGLLRDAAKADSGIIDDSRGRIDYLTLYDLYNLGPALTIDGNNREVFLPYAPVRDDQKRRNQMIISRPNGGTGTVDDLTDQAKAGLYSGTDTLNLGSDADLAQRASYAVIVGTVPGKRYPQVTIDLLRAPQYAEAWAKMRLGQRFGVVNPPRGGARGAFQLQMRGYTQMWLNRRIWKVTANTVRADPYNVGVLDDPVLGRAECDSCVAGIDYGQADVTVSVVTTPLIPDTATFPTEVPFDLNWQGEKVTITNVANTSNPQILTMARGQNNVHKSHPGPSNLTLWQPMRAGLP